MCGTSCALASWECERYRVARVLQTIDVFPAWDGRGQISSAQIISVVEEA